MTTPVPAASTTLRSRNRRRTHEEDESDPTAPLRDAEPASSSSSRAASPPVRTRSSERDQVSAGFRSSSRFLRVPSLRAPQTATTNTFSGFWESSWSSLRGIGSDLIGSNALRDSSPSVPLGRRRPPLEATHGRNSSAPPPQWGPRMPADRELGSGTNEHRRAEVEAKKRERLLMANGHVLPDGSGRYKKRDSDERDRVSIPPAEGNDREALVYLHNVKPADTLAGVMIKYNCQPNVFKKANRFWPNDSIQVRKSVFLPVDACGVKGRKIPNTELASHNLVERGSDEATLTPRPLQPSWGELQETVEGKHTPFSSVPTSPSMSMTLSNVDNSHFKHDSWVIIDGFPEPVEIVRTSRRALGYFPHARRKSQSFSDLKTPSASCDLSRSSHQSNSPRQAARSRSGSNAHFATFQGPGGVGTMSKNVRNPGPASDGLNRIFPSLEHQVAPQSLMDFQHLNSAGLNGLENIGGALEGWVRKVATKATASLQPSMVGGTPGMGDSMELTEDAFDSGTDGPTLLDRATSAGSGIGSEVGDWRTGQERILKERFPPRGTVVTKGAD